MSRRQLRYMVPLFLSGLSLLAAYFLQYQRGLLPCTMCLMERALMWLVFLSSLWCCLRAARGHVGRLAAPRLAAMVGALLGMLVAGRHTWLQHFGSSTGCAPELDYMLRHWPWQKTIAMLFSSQECALVDWTLLGLSLAAWALVAFGAVLLWILAAPLLLRNRLAD